MYNVTVFNAKENAKRAFSPFGDKTFEFETLKKSSLSSILREAAISFILNIPLDIDKKIRTYRRKENLSSLIQKRLNYFIIDVDHISTKDNLNKVLNYFKNYKCFILESRSYNGVDYFSIKGVIECDLELKHLKYAVNKIHYDLIDIGDFDQSVSRIGTLNAPIGKFNVLLDNSDCENIIRFSDIDVSLVKSDLGVTDLIDLKHIQLNIDFNQDITNVDELCLYVFQLLGFDAISTNSDNSISFKHPSEKKTPGGYFWYRTSPFIMHHFNKSKTLNIFEYIKTNPLFKKIANNAINYTKELQVFNPKNKVITINKRFLSVTEDIETAISEFIEVKNGLFTIKSPMGSGKSVIIQRIIKEAIDSDMRILIITNRVSVAEDFKTKYGIKLYNQDQYSIGDSLICQFDSLWKYNIKNFDLVILDEFISLMLHSRSALNNSQINIAKFFASFNLKLVIADAFLTGYENKLINKSNNLYYLNNVYRDDTTLYNYTNFNYFVYKILEKAKNNKITVSSTSLNFLNALFLLLRKLKYKVITLTADTPQSTKALIYKCFEKDDNEKFDILLYSPTLTVGVSNLNNVPYHFHFDSSMTSDVISSLQMIKRTRKSKEIHFFIKNRVNFLKTNVSEIRDDYVNEIGKSIDNNFLFELNDYGEVKLSHLGKKCILIDAFKNILEFNHKKAFEYLLSYHFKNEPITIEDKFETNVLLKYQKENKENTENLLQETFEQYLLLNDIDKVDLPKNSSYEKIYEIDSNLELVSPKIKKEIFKIAIKDTGFILKCKFYKLLKNYLDNVITDVDLQIIVSKAILKNNLQIIEFISKINGLKDFTNEFKCCKIKDTKLRYICNKLGFRLKSKGNGMQVYAIPDNVLKYYQYVSLTFN